MFIWKILSHLTEIPPSARSHRAGLARPPYAGLYPSTFAESRFRNEDSVFVTHKCSSGGLGGGGEGGKVPERFCYFSILDAING